MEMGKILKPGKTYSSIFLLLYWNLYYYTVYRYKHVAMVLSKSLSMCVVICLTKVLTLCVYTV